MNVDLQMAVEGYKSKLFLKPDMYDGHPPIDSISYQTRMRVHDPNVSAVSTAIVLQNYTSESINFHKPVQAHVADAIEIFLHNRKIRVGPIEQNPALISVGNRPAMIGESRAADNSQRHNANIVAFSLGDTHSFTSFASINSVHISSNVACFFPNDDIGILLSNISAAVFVAPDYAIGEICLNKNDVKLLGEIEFTRYQKLLDSVNLKLIEEG